MRYVGGTTGKYAYLYGSSLEYHLGSVRASVNGAGSVSDRSDYYLFGERWSGDGVEATTNRYQYNGKESQTLLAGSSGISDFLDYGARHYNANLGRWSTPDPLSENRLKYSPYVYCSNNPIVNIDPDGNLDDYYLNVVTSKIEHQEGSDNRVKEGLVHLADDKATVGDIEDAMTAKGYEFRRNLAVSGGYEVNTAKSKKALYMMHIYDPETSGEILSLGLGSVVKSVTRSRVKGWSFMSSKETLRPLGLGSTGRNVAKTLDEHLAMKEIKARPMLGNPIIRNLGDSRWQGWTKIEYRHKGLSGNPIIIHYVGKFENGRLIAIDDFKFVDNIIK